MQVFKSNRLFSYECLGQTKLGECQVGHKWKICRYDFHLKAYFLKKWNFCSPGVLERLEKLKKHRISSQKISKKLKNFFFVKLLHINCDGSGMVSERVLGREASHKPFKIIIKWFPKNFENRFFGLKILFFSKFPKIYKKNMILTSFQIQ